MCSCVISEVILDEETPGVLQVSNNNFIVCMYSVFNEAQRLCSHEIFQVIFPFGHVLIPLYLKQKVLWRSDLFECCSCSELGQFKHKKTKKKDENCSLKLLQERISTLYSLRLH